MLTDDPAIVNSSSAARTRLRDFPLKRRQKAVFLVKFRSPFVLYLPGYSAGYPEVLLTRIEDGS